MQFLFIHIYPVIRRVIWQVICRVIRPARVSGYLMLLNLTNQFIKLSNGDLQSESYSEFFLGLQMDILRRAEAQSKHGLNFLKIFELF